ncbi:hypothetical protein L218DRAFT_110727 [Marasmius fiardii PR-910]|nr:hypothetical protein L218DRAFT_110727 [Marasmius fiardii PR-910]
MVTTDDQKTSGIPAQVCKQQRQDTGRYSSPIMHAKPLFLSDFAFGMHPHLDRHKVSDVPECTIFQSSLIMMKSSRLQGYGPRGIYICQAPAPCQYQNVARSPPLSDIHVLSLGWGQHFNYYAF